jgi:hypothetical protein
MARLAKVSTRKITNEREKQALSCGFTMERVTVRGRKANPHH